MRNNGALIFTFQSLSGEPSKACFRNERRSKTLRKVSRNKSKSQAAGLLNASYEPVLDLN